MNFKGTKGNWKVDGSFPELVIDKDNNDVCVLSYRTFSKQRNDYRYNALLISKAPEMLEMLEELVYQFERINNSAQEDELLEQAQQLIKQATEL